MKTFKIVLPIGLLLLSVAACEAVSGISFKTLAAFNDTNNGAYPYAPPALGADGALYGTLPYGSTNGGGRDLPGYHQRLTIRSPFFFQ